MAPSYYVSRKEWVAKPNQFLETIHNREDEISTERRTKWKGAKCQHAMERKGTEGRKDMADCRTISWREGV